MLTLIQISIHALLAESDYQMQANYLQQDTFLSTLSLRRATQIFKIKNNREHNFYPRSPCGERRHWQTGQSRTRHFYPRSPCGERPPHAKLTGTLDYSISIHALLAESD